MQTMKEPLRSENRQYGVVLLMMLGGVCASALMYWTTSWGPGVVSDSTIYLESAQNLIDGNGLFIDSTPMFWSSSTVKVPSVNGQPDDLKPMTHYPPLYPILLGFFSLFTNGDLLSAARFMIVLLFAINLVLLGLAVRASTGGNVVATSYAMLFFLASFPFLGVHALAMTESPYITFSMAGVLLLASHIARPRTYLLITASLFVGFAAGTRYVGVVLFPTVGLAILSLGSQSLRHRVRDLIVFAGIACLPLASWVVRNFLLISSPTNRKFDIHPFRMDHARRLIITVHDFFLPISISGWAKAVNLAVVITFLLLGGTLLYRKKYFKDHSAEVSVTLPSICAIYIVLYVSFLVVSISFFDAAIPLNNRLMMPVIPALVVIILSCTWSLSEALNQRYLWYGFLILASFSISINAYRAIPKAKEIHDNGVGYTARRWKDPEFVAYLSGAPAGINIYSNQPAAVRFLTGKSARYIPLSAHRRASKENKLRQERWNQVIRECERGNAIIAHYHTDGGQLTSLVSKEEIESVANIRVLEQFNIGRIYGFSAYERNAKQGD